MGGLELDLRGVLLAWLGPSVVGAAITAFVGWVVKGRLQNYFAAEKAKTDARFAQELESHKQQLGLLTEGARSQFSHDLERYKQELSVLTEGAKFDYQRRLQDFNLFTARRHAVYAECNRLLQAAFQKVWEHDVSIGDDFLVKVPTPHAAREVLKNVGMENAAIEQVTTNWNAVPPAERDRAITQVVQNHARQSALDAKRVAVSYVHENHLYLSDSVHEAALRAIKQLQAPSNERDNTSSDTEALKALRAAMRAELAMEREPNAEK